MNAKIANYKVMRCKNLNSENLSNYYFKDLSEAENEMVYAEKLCLGAYLYEKIKNKWVYIHD